MILPILNIITKLFNNMHKSSIIGFFLVSSLIFGSGNMMILQGAVAQDYYNDDEQYGDSPYSGYRDDNNNNYYPLKDYDNNKKYVCKNGPFEGFLVSSVEFCKHFKFDDIKDRDNKVGPQGPQGETGPQGIQGIQGERGLTGATGPASTVPGPQGERGFNGTNGINGMQGPAGISKINESNYYSLVGSINSTTPTDDQAVSTISCLPGDFALSGEYLIFFSTEVSPTVTFFGSLGLNPPTSWATTITGLPGQGVQTTVNCFDNSP